jgi:hypothetical protein
MKQIRHPTSRDAPSRVGDKEINHKEGGKRDNRRRENAPPRPRPEV